MPSQSRESLGIESFIDALNDGDLEYAVHREKPASVQEALKIGQDYEAFQYGRRQKNTKYVRFQTDRSSSANRNGLPMSPKRDDFPMSPKRHNFSPQSPARSPSRPTANSVPRYASSPTITITEERLNQLIESKLKDHCNYCNELGHTWKECPKRPSRKEKMKTQPTDKQHFQNNQQKSHSQHTTDQHQSTKPAVQLPLADNRTTSTSYCPPYPFYSGHNNWNANTQHVPYNSPSYTTTSSKYTQGNQV